MPTNMELRSLQTDKLFDLLKIKQDNKDITVKGLEPAISKAKAVMTQEDVVWVEKLVADLKE